MSYFREASKLVVQLGTVGALVAGGSAVVRAFDEPPAPKDFSCVPADRPNIVRTVHADDDGSITFETPRTPGSKYDTCVVYGAKARALTP